VAVLGLVAALAGAGAGGCGGLSHVVDRDLLRDISVENKLLLFEAENELGIALDEQEQIVRQINETRRQVDGVGSQRGAADSDRERAENKKDDKAAQVAASSHQVLDLKRGYLEARVRALREKLSAQEGLVRVAFAKYELAKAKLVKKNNVRGADKLDLADFEKQVDESVAVVREQHKAVDAADKEVDDKRKEWLTARSQLEKASGGGAASPWADDAMAWGAP
jgi:hypothetical protein